MNNARWESPGDLEWGKQVETGGKQVDMIAGGEGQVGKATYLWMWLQSPRWLIPKVAQPQIPPSKSQKRAKLVSVCALTQQVWEAGSERRVVVW